MTIILSNLNWFTTFFTGRFLFKFAVKCILKIPPHLAYVADINVSQGSACVATFRQPTAKEISTSGELPLPPDQGLCPQTPVTFRAHHVAHTTYEYFLCTSISRVHIAQTELNGTELGQIQMNWNVMQWLVRSCNYHSFCFSQKLLNIILTAKFLIYSNLMKQPDELVQKTRHGTNYTHTHARTHTFNGPLSGTTWLSRYQEGKTNLDFTEARDSEWQWHLLGRMQVCTSLQTDNHASTPPLSFLQAGCPSCRPTNSARALKAVHKAYKLSTLFFGMHNKLKIHA